MQGIALQIACLSVHGKLSLSNKYIIIQNLYNYVWFCCKETVIHPIYLLLVHSYTFGCLSVGG